MDALKKRIIEEAKIFPGEILVVDGFLNHQIDVDLLSRCGAEWYKMFKDDRVTKIFTIEASGIAIACLTAQHFEIPVVYAKKDRSSHNEDKIYSVKAVSYTHGTSYDIIVPKEYIKADDRILIIDDFLSGGSDLKALITIAEQAGATVVGVGVAVEKTYQGSADRLRRLGYRIESLVKIDSLHDGVIKFSDD